MSLVSFRHNALPRAVMLSAAALMSAAALLPATASAQNPAAIPVLHPRIPAVVASGAAQPLSLTDTTKTLPLALTLPLRNEAQLDALLADLYNPASPLFHHYLTADQFAAAYGPTQADYDKLSAWATAQGLTVTHTTPNRVVLDVTGSVGAINHAFHIALHNYQDPATGRIFHAPDATPSINLDLQLDAISGLENALPKHTHLKRDPLLGSSHVLGNPVVAGGGAHANATVQPKITGSGPGNTYLPSDMRAAYYGTGSLTGAGQTVAVFSYDGYNTSDVTGFYSSTGTSTNVPVKNVLVNGFNGACFGFTSAGAEDPSTCDDGEQVLDIVNVIGMAPGLTQVLFYEGSSSTDILNQMATDNTAKVITSSWGGGDFGTASDAPFKQFQSQGQTYLNATGDSGQFNSSTYDPPSLDPYILQVGGTDLTTAGAGGAWSGETGWLDSGGGFYKSAGYAIPTWQQTSGVITTANGGSTAYRNAPDVAAEANFDNTTYDDGSFESGYGGTSYATPRWAGFLALVNQQSIANGNSTIGFINPTLYTLGLGSSTKTDYHDITSGNNKPSAGSGSGFNAVAGYDLVTGWGSPNGVAMINALAGTKTTATPGYTLAASPASLSVAQGKTGTSTISVTDTNGFTGSVAFTVGGLPTGVTAAFSPTSSTTSSTLTFTVGTSAAAGTSTVTVTGTSGSLTQTATVSLTVTSTATSTPTQLIVNGGFETGTATPWTLSANTLCSNSSCSGETSHSGSWFVWLDGYGSTHTDTASQSVAITAGKSTATLSFYLHINTAETTTTTAYDKMTVQLLNSSGTVLTTLGTFSNLNAATGYTVHTYNVSSYIGQTVTLKFTGTEDNSKQTSFVLDDVSLTVQ